MLFIHVPFCDYNAMMKGLTYKGDDKLLPKNCTLTTKDLFA